MYFLIASLWIYILNATLEIWLVDLRALARGQTLSAWALVIFTSMFIYWLYKQRGIQGSSSNNRKLEETEEYRLLTKHSRDIIYRFRLRPEVKMEYISPSITPVTGYTPEEYYQDNMLLFKHTLGKDRKILQSDFKSRIKIDEPRIIRWKRKNDEVLWIEHRSVPIMDNKWDLIAIEGIARDITSQKQTEDALRESEQNLRYMFKHMQYGVYRTTSDGKIVMANPRFAALVGAKSSEELIGKNISDLKAFSQYPRELFKAELDEKGTVRNFISTWIGKDNREIRVKETAHRVKDETGRVQYYEGIVEEVPSNVQSEMNASR